MWFLFGFITFLSFAGYAAYKRLHAAWQGVHGHHAGVAYHYKILRGKYGITGLLIGIEGLPGYDFRFKGETRTDRFFKWIGLSVEHQVGNPTFDRRVYVVSDDARLHRHISLNTSVVNGVLGVFDSGDGFQCQAKEIRNNAGRLWVKYKALKGFDNQRVRALAQQVVANLDGIRAALGRDPLPRNRGWRDPFVFKAAVILAISSGLAINGLVQAVRLIWTTVPFTVNPKVLLIDASWWGLVIVAVLVLATLLLLGRTARTHLVLVELLLIGSFGAVATAFAELRDINMEFDASPVQEFHAELHDKRIQRGRRRSKSYYLYLDDWTGERAERKVKVSADLYRTVTPGDHLAIYQKSGYLGYRWVARLKKR